MTDTMEDKRRMFAECERELSAIRAGNKPVENKLTTLSRAPATHKSYYGGKNGRCEDVYFCVADHVNVAGYVLTWRQIWKRQRLSRRWNWHRSMWAAKLTHTAATNIAKRRMEKSMRLHEQRIRRTAEKGGWHGAKA